MNLLIKLINTAGRTIYVAPASVVSLVQVATSTGKPVVDLYLADGRFVSVEADVDALAVKLGVVIDDQPEA